MGKKRFNKFVHSGYEAKLGKMFTKTEISFKFTLWHSAQSALFMLKT